MLNICEKLYKDYMKTLHCKQCGTCCQKGGPLLHKTDVALLAQGHMNFSHMLTLRAAELVHDPVYNKLIPLEEEAVKICGTGEQAFPWHCIFHTKQGCGLHPLRPTQCEALFCADTTALESMYHEERLTRHDILSHENISQQGGWLELAEAHEEQCPLRPLVSLAAALHDAPSASENDSLTEELLQSVRYDLSFRELCVEKAGMDKAVLSFVLGRPVYVFVQSLGFAVYTDASGDLALKKLAKAPYFT